MGLLDNLDKLLKGAEKVISTAEKYASKMEYENVKRNNGKIGLKTISEWEREWEYIGILQNANLSQYRNYVGVYKAILHGKLVYIGRAIEWNNGGFRKRLSDYTRDSNSARKHKSGQLMNNYAGELQMYIIKTGTDEKAAQNARKLELALIGKYDPPWNVKKL